MTSATIKSVKSKLSNPNSWTLRLFTLLVWLLVGLCVAYWAFKFATTKAVAATAALPATTVVVDSKAIGKFLGATDVVAKAPVNTKADTKFVLFGLASTARGQGVALIALDGKPAKPYRVGSVVADDLVLKSISKTGVMLATSVKAPDGVTLELPERKPASLAPITPIAARFTAPNMPNAMPNTLAPAFNPAVPPAQQPNIPQVMPSVAMPGAAAAIGAIGAAGVAGAANPTGLADRAPPISRFAPRNLKDGTPDGSNLPTATSSSTGER